MSRIGYKPISIPEGVTVEVNAPIVKVSGKLGILETQFSPKFTVKIEDKILIVDRDGSDKPVKAEHGRIGSDLTNMIKGVTSGWQKKLEMVGTGYRARLEGTKLVLSLGYSHPIEVVPPIGIQFVVEGQNVVIVSGINKALVGQMAANIRIARPPEPYKGKGVRYAGEFVRRKAGKAAK